MPFCLISLFCQNFGPTAWNLILTQTLCFQVMVRKVHLSLRYFQDAVVKGTYELLPGCATVVLETILALQSYAMSRRDPR